MAKRLHRTTPASENHPIQGWEVSNATARAALPLTVADLGRVARQHDDGSLWSLRSVSPVEWRQIDPSPDDLAVPALAAQAAAEAARTAAETAADTAQNSSGTYASTAAGLAAVASGAYFYVPDGAGGLIRYLDNAGVAVEVGRVAAGAVVQELVASVPPRSTDAAGDLDVAVDAVGRVYRRTRSDGGLVLAGRSESVQDRLAELDGIQVQEDMSGWQDFGVDAQGRVVRAVDAAGGQRIAGRAESVQASLDRIEQQAELLLRPTGGISLPANFAALQKPLCGEERYVWAGMPAALRPNQTKIVAYPFEWDSADQVVASMMARRQGTLNPHGRWEQITWAAEEAITVNAPVGYFTPGAYPNGRQFRDGAHMYDRKAGKHYFCISGISGTADGWKSTNVPIFSSTDGLAWDFVAFTPDMGTGAPTLDRAWTPDWFVDSDGTLYIILAGYENNARHANAWLWRCDNPDTMASWTKLGEVSGSALPYVVADGYPHIIDMCLFQRHGVYYLIWKSEAETVAGSEEKAQMGIAWATSILGPYNGGHRFMAPSGERMKGEGICVIELPPGRPYRYRLFWDNYIAASYAGVGAGHMFADTNDFVTFTPPKPTGFPMTANGKDRNTTFSIGY